MWRADLGVRKLKEDRRTDCDQCGDHILQFWRIVGSLINYRSPRKTKRKPLASPGIQYCPIKGPGGNACNEVNHSFQRETPRHAGEPPSSARNSLDLLKRKDIWIRRRCCVAGEAREKTICVGRDEGSRSDSDESAEVNLDVEGHGKSSKLRGIFPRRSRLRSRCHLVLRQFRLPPRIPLKGTCSLASARLAKTVIRDITATRFVFFICLFFLWIVAALTEPNQTVSAFRGSILSH